MPARRLPPPWSVDELEACFVVTDSAGQKLAYIYFEEDPGRRSAAKQFTKDATLQRAVLITRDLATYWQKTHRCAK